MIEGSRRPLGLIIAAFATIYFVFGSTYLAIRLAIDTLPPFLMAGIRFLIAGGLLYGWARLRGAKRPALSHWKQATVIGTLLLVTGNGAVVFAQQTVPTGVSSLVIALVPVWMVLFDWMSAGRPARPGLVLTGLFLGLGGVAVLLGPAMNLQSAGLDPLGSLVLLGASLSWAAVSISARYFPVPDSLSLAAAMQMLIGGAILKFGGLLAGEASQVNLGAVSGVSLVAMGYLVVIGSLLGYSAYTWLLKTVSVASVSSYAFVNPVVAVFLGGVFAGEPLTPNVVFGAMAIISGVALLVTNKLVDALVRKRNRNRQGELCPHNA